jgi:tetratricopeptide (TPR) repeat protein
MKTLLIISIFTACAVPSYSQGDAAAVVSRSTVPAPGTYDHGMLQRRQGDYSGAKQTFIKLLLENPAGAGALEGLGLSCIGLGQYEEAAVYLEQWNQQSPGNRYILGLLGRARSGMRDDKGLLRVYSSLAAMDPRDCSARQRAESYFERAGYGAFPRAKSYRSVSLEGLDTASPQRIIYEGSSASARFRSRLKDNLDLIGGVELRREAQRNGGRGFTYYDIQELIYSAGLSGRTAAGLGWEAEYGQSALSDISSPGSEHISLGRARLRGEWRSSALTLDSQPKFVRGSGSSGYFILMRENSARAETEYGLLGWNWLTRAGAYDLSDGHLLGTVYHTGSREYAPGLVQASYSHGQQEFYSASAAGRLRYAHTDRLSLGLRRGKENVYRAGASMSQAWYSDSNRLGQLAADVKAWLPGHSEFSGGYRFELRNFLEPVSGYDSVDDSGHWLGAYWNRCAGYNWSVSAGYEHGFLRDSLLSYNADVYLAEAEWYSGRASVKLQGRRKTTDARGHSWSAGLQARINF